MRKATLLTSGLLVIPFRNDEREGMRGHRSQLLTTMTWVEEVLEGPSPNIVTRRLRQR